MTGYSKASESAAAADVKSQAESFVFLGANTPWVYALAESLALQGNRISAIATYDTRTYRREKPQWPQRDVPGEMRREYWVYPPGYAGTLSRFFAPILRSRLKKALRPREGTKRHPWIVAPYPWFTEALRKIPAEWLIYYHFDDYTLYLPSRREKVLAQEAEMVNRAALTLCVSQSQFSLFKSRFPLKEASMVHFPLGAVASQVNPTPEQAPENRMVVGYIGNLIDRVDWRLVTEVARLMPDVDFHFVGGLDGFSGGGTRPNWEKDRELALASPNVKHIGRIPQDEVGSYYWNFTVMWIPYDIEHAFNRECCPTKIMDGLASGRPVLSTDVPECRYYPEFISIFHSPDEAAAQIRNALQGCGSSPAQTRSQRQTEFVRQHHLWDCRAQWLTETLSQR